MSPSLHGLLLGVLAVVAFGFTLPVTRYVSPELDPTFIGLGRAFVAGLVAALILYVTKQPWPTRGQWQQLMIVASGVVFGFPVFTAWAMKYAPAAHGGVVLGLLPLATAAVGALIAKERPSLGFWLFAVLGSVLVVVYALYDGGGYFQWADLMLLIAGLAAAVGYAFGGRLSRDMGGWQVICWALVLGLPFVTIPTLWLAPQDFRSLPSDIWIGFLYLALVSQLFGFFWWNKGLALGGIARVSQAQLLQPFVTVVAATLMLGEHIGLHTLVFVFAVVACVGLGRRFPIQRDKDQ